MEARKLVRWGTLWAVVAVLAVLAALAAGCGSSGSDPVAGATNAGPGLQTSQPPWRPEYAHLAQRIRALGLPPAGTERFHIHALLRVYVDGILSPVPQNIGIDESKGIETSLHTHDRTGIVHMESTHPHRFTLGDFLAVWGVKLGPDRIGGLSGDDVHFFLNGRPLRDPAAYAMHDGDNIVIGVGPLDSFPHNPSTELLRAVKNGTIGCSTSRSRRVRSCFAPSRGGG